MQEAIAYKRSAQQQWFRSSWLAPVIVALLALATRLSEIDRVPSFDELYHLLAARGWLAEGELRIADGVYDRASVFTILIAGFFALLGESIEVARMPSVLAGAALVVLVFLWTRRVAGTAAAWIAALLVCLWPDGMYFSQYARFYALQGLAFWLGAIGTYQLFTEPARGLKLGLLVVGTLAAYALALHLQPVTAIGLLGVGVWVGLVRVVPWLTASLPRQTRWLAAVGLVVLASLVAALILQSELGADLLDRYRATPLWMAEYRNEVWFYHLQYVQDYPTLWSLAGFAVLVGIAYRPEPTVFCACVFAVAFLALSFAGPKGPRFAYHVTPFLLVLWAIALAGVWPYLRRLVEDILARALAWLRLEPLGRPAALAVIALVLAHTVIANSASVKAAARLLGLPLLPSSAAGWPAVKPELMPWLENATVVVTTSELPALYYLGRHDLLVSRSRLEEIQGVEFSLDPRTGRPVISTPRSLELVMECYPDALIVSGAASWRTPVDLDHDVANLIVARATPIDLNDDRMLAFVWERPPDVSRPADCPRLPSIAAAGTSAADG